MRSKILLLLLASLLAALIHTGRPVLAQAVKPEARKFDEFGDIQYSDLIARLDNFAIQLQQEPDARGFLIVYRTRRDLPGLSNRYAQRMKTYMVKARGIDKNRVVTVDGGAASCLTQELWIVPRGATPPPRSDAYSRVFVDRDSARKYDEFSFYTPAEEKGEYPGYDYITDEAADLETFAQALRREPRSRAYLIAYGQHYVERGYMDSSGWQPGKGYSRTHLDPAGTARKKLTSVRNTLARTYGIAPSRVSIIDGGYRKTRMLELWIVPPGEDAPIATPSSRPVRNGRRRS